MVPSVHHVPQGACGPLTITEGTSNAITSLNSVSCNNGFGHTDNSYWRAFLLSDFGIVNDYDICNVQIGVEEAASGTGTGQPLTLNLYTDSGLAFPAGYPGTLTLIGTASITVADQSLTLLDIPITATAPAGSQLVVEIFTPDGTVAGNLFFIGSNASPETNPSYLQAADCGIPTPTTTGDIGFPDMHIVMNVTGTEATAVFVATPTALEVDPLVLLGVSGNNVLELNEDAIINPTWSNDGVDDFTLTGVVTNLTGPGVLLTPTIVDSTADYGLIVAGTSADCLGSTGDCYTISIAGVRADQPQHLDWTIDETVTPLAPPPAFAEGTGILKTWTLHVGESFTDVLASDLFYPSIENIFHNGVTAGCLLGDTYCPLQNVLRQEMAVFLLKSFLGSAYVPPACVPPGIYSDTPCPGLYTDWAEDLFTRGITGGCQVDPDPLAFCPERDILRQEMAVFLLKTLLGSAYVPPACVPPGIYADMPCPGLYTDWAEDLFTRGITAGCQVDPDPLAFCPESPITRQEMAPFLTLTFGLVLYGP